MDTEMFVDAVISLIRWITNMIWAKLQKKRPLRKTVKITSPNSIVTNGYKVVLIFNAVGVRISHFLYMKFYPFCAENLRYFREVATIGEFWRIFCAKFAIFYSRGYVLIDKKRVRFKERERALRIKCVWVCERVTFLFIVPLFRTAKQTISRKG